MPVHRDLLEDICKKDKGPHEPQPASHGDYFNEVLTDEKEALSVVPRLFTAAMMASEMPAAIRPYSMAVAPD